MGVEVDFKKVAACPEEMVPVYQEVSEDHKMTEAEKEELEKLRALIAKVGKPRRRVVQRKRISAPEVLNEAPTYGSAFSRGLRIELPGYSLLFISGTASVNEEGKTAHVGDFKAQVWRTFRNITALLASEGATWYDVVRTTCYLRDIDRDYKAFNEVRTQFYRELGLDPLPASTGVQAKICRPDLLVEIEAIAIIPKEE